MVCVGVLGEHCARRRAQEFRILPRVQGWCTGSGCQKKNHICVGKPMYSMNPRNSSVVVQHFVQRFTSTALNPTFGWLVRLRGRSPHSLATSSKTLVYLFEIPGFRTLIKALNTAWIVSLLLPLELVRRSLRSAGLSPLQVPSGDSLRQRAFATTFSVSSAYILSCLMLSRSSGSRQTVH